jgi:putative DNA primase/helicase
LTISAAFVGPLLHLAGLESGGLHLFGTSSTGKTTLLKLAASVWGDSGVVRSWRATANGLEGVANRTSDVILILDELGQRDTKDAATALYMLASGVGKIRMNRNATLQDIKTWRAFMLSSGEMTVEAKMTQLRGSKAYTGATLRLLNVAADRGLGFGVFDGAGATGDVRDLVNAFGAAAASTYGVAGPENGIDLLHGPGLRSPSGQRSAAPL